MRKAVLITLGNIILGYFLFSTGLYIISYLFLGGVVFDNPEDLKNAIDRTLWYVDFILCPAIALLVGLITGCLSGRGAWNVALLSTIPIFVYLYMVKFPAVEVSIVGEMIRGGRYIVMGTLAALLISRLKQRIGKRKRAEGYDLPEYG